MLIVCGAVNLTGVMILVCCWSFTLQSGLHLDKISVISINILWLVVWNLCKRVSPCSCCLRAKMYHLGTENSFWFVFTTLEMGFWPFSPCRRTIIQCCFNCWCGCFGTLMQDLVLHRSRYSLCLSCSCLLISVFVDIFGSRIDMLAYRAIDVVILMQVNMWFGIEIGYYFVCVSMFDRLIETCLGSPNMFDSSRLLSISDILAVCLLLILLDFLCSLCCL